MALSSLGYLFLCISQVLAGSWSPAKHVSWWTHFLSCPRKRKPGWLREVSVSSLEGVTGTALGNRDQSWPGGQREKQRSYNQQPKSRSWQNRHRRCWWTVCRPAQSHFVGKDHTGLSHLKRLGILLDLALDSIYHFEISSIWSSVFFFFFSFIVLMSLQHLHYPLPLHLEISLLAFLILTLLPFLLYLSFLLLFLRSSASSHPNCSVQEMVVCISRTQDIGLDQG